MQRIFSELVQKSRSLSQKLFRFFPLKASSKSTAKPRCCRSVVGSHRVATPCEVCYRSVRVFIINALNLKHFYNVGHNFSRQRIFAVSHKNTQFSELFIEKGLVGSAVTMDNAKMLSQLMSISTSLAKINERRLQPLLD